MADFPRKPEAYRPGNHFGQRKKDRNVPGEAIRKCIEEGEPTGDGHGSNIKLRAEWGAVTYWVVLNPETGHAISCGYEGQ